MINSIIPTGASGGGGGGGVANPLDADLDVANFKVKSTTSDLTLDATATAGADIILDHDDTGTASFREDGTEYLILDNHSLGPRIQASGGGGNFFIQPQTLKQFSVQSGGGSWITHWGSASNEVKMEMVTNSTLQLTGTAKIEGTVDVLLDATTAVGGNVVTIPDSAGAFIVQQDGGTPGTHEVQFLHNGTQGIIDCKNGSLDIKGAGTVFLRSNSFAVGTTSTFCYQDIGAVGTVDIGNTTGGANAFRDLYLSGTANTGAATTSKPSLNIPHGSAPTSPTDGDMWTTTAGLYVRINGSTVGPLS